MNVIEIKLSLVLYFCMLLLDSFIAKALTVKYLCMYILHFLLSIGHDRGLVFYVIGS